MHRLQFTYDCKYCGQPCDTGHPSVLVIDQAGRLARRSVCSFKCAAGMIADGASVEPGDDAIAPASLGGSCETRSLHAANETYVLAIARGHGPAARAGFIATLNTYARALLGFPT